MRLTHWQTLTFVSNNIGRLCGSWIPCSDRENLRVLSTLGYPFRDHRITVILLSNIVGLSYSNASKIVQSEVWRSLLRVPRVMYFARRLPNY